MQNGLVQTFFAPATRPRLVRAEGIWFIDSDGRRYIDASSGSLACNLGHGNARILDAMARQARDLAFAFPTQFETDANAKLGERLAELCGPGLDRASLVSGGSEAIETAIKFLRQHAVAIGQKDRWNTQESWARQCAAALENTIRREGPETVLAFVMEPVGGTSSGANVPHEFFHVAVREICTRHGIALVHDEVMCGAGRTGRFLASDH